MVSLPVYRKALQKALRRYEDVFEGLRFGAFPDMGLTPDKPYTAKTVVPVHYAGSSAGEMVIVQFSPGDGTGNFDTYRFGEVRIPPAYQHEERPERVVPRSKEGVLVEGLFPLWSRGKVGTTHAWFGVSLEELTLDASRTIVHAWDLGNDPLRYGDMLSVEQEIPPTVYCTVGTDADGKRFGDPHAIYNPVHRGAFQVAGFLSLRDERNPLMRMVERWVRPSGQ